MDTVCTNPVTGCRATLSDSSLVYEPGVLVAHTQTQNQLLLEHDWWIRNEWRVEEARSMYEYLAQHTESVTEKLPLLSIMGITNRRIFPPTESNSGRYENATRQPTGSDARWRDSLKLDWNMTPSPGTGRYFCPVCGVRFPLSVQLSDHMSGFHGIGIEPNYLNEYSVGEIVSGINNLAVGRKFRFDMSAEKPKFLMEPNVKIPWMGKPLFEKQEKPSSMDTALDNQVVDIYRNTPTSQLSSESPASHLRDRLSRTMEGNVKSRPPVPAAMTSKL
eukprot:5547407-Amphidinium_carterae.1